MGTDIAMTKQDAAAHARTVGLAAGLLACTLDPRLTPENPSPHLMQASLTKRRHDMLTACFLTLLMTQASQLCLLLLGTTSEREVSAGGTTSSAQEHTLNKPTTISECKHSLWHSLWHERQADHASARKQLR